MDARHRSAGRGHLQRLDDGGHDRGQLGQHRLRERRRGRDLDHEREGGARGDDGRGGEGPQGPPLCRHARPGRVRQHRSGRNLAELQPGARRRVRELSVRHHGPAPPRRLPLRRDGRLRSLDPKSRGRGRMVTLRQCARARAGREHGVDRRITDTVARLRRFQRRRLPSGSERRGLDRVSALQRSPGRRSGAALRDLDGALLARRDQHRRVPQRARSVAVDLFRLRAPSHPVRVLRPSRRRRVHPLRQRRGHGHRVQHRRRRDLASTRRLACNVYVQHRDDRRRHVRGKSRWIVASISSEHCCGPRYARRPID